MRLRSGGLRGSRGSPAGGPPPDLGRGRWLAGRTSTATAAGEPTRPPASPPYQPGSAALGLARAERRQTGGGRVWLNEAGRGDSGARTVVNGWSSTSARLFPTRQRSPPYLLAASSGTTC